MLHCGSAGCGSAGINSSCAVFSRKYGISSYVHFCGEEEVKYIVLMYFGGEFVSAFCGEDRVKYNEFFFLRKGVKLKHATYILWKRRGRIITACYMQLNEG